MCFIRDYTWRAEVVEESAHRSLLGKACCDECARTIPVGEIIHGIYMQEHEACQTCDRDMNSTACTCEEPDFGETFDYIRCPDCHQFLDAVEEIENEAGCSGDESRPGLGTMITDIQDSGVDNAKRYFKTALHSYPTLARSGYLGWLWRRMFV